jgi:hypothetical protein
MQMAHKTFSFAEELRSRYQPRKDLEGPFFYPNGRVAYYDPKEGAYWDPNTDFYLSHEEATELQNTVFDYIKS